MRRFLCISLLLLLSCSKTTPRSNAFKATSRAQLVGGKRALGEVGDYVLSNSIIHAVVQDVGFSRGFGAFGGSLIDIDLVRPGPTDPVTGPKFGNDYFTEMFPAFFLQASEPYKVEIAADGSDGGPAIIRVTGDSGNFISIVKAINGTLVPSTSLTYEIDYILEPGAQYLKIQCTMRNDGATQADFPLVIPFGFIALLGEGQHLFVPGKSGYDVRFNLEDNVYPNFYAPPLSVQPEALPGVVAPMWATEGSGVSYALAASPRNAGYMGAHKDFYPSAKADSMLIPVAYSSFLGSYWSRSPSTLAAGKSWAFTGYLAVGAGDVGSAQRVIYNINDPMQRQPVKTGELAGRASEKGTDLSLVGASVVIQDDQGNYVSQAKADSDGMYSAPVPPGKYKVDVVDPVRGVGSSDFVTVTEGNTSRLDVSTARAGAIAVEVTDENGRDVPAKISVQGVYPNTSVDPPRKFLYSFADGERYRVSDMDPDTSDPASRKYLERVIFAPHGAASSPIRPGHYTVWASRGNEYSLESKDVDVYAGKTATVELKLTQVMPTPGWASADFHVHSINSVDSDMKLDDRVMSYAVEGVDIVTSTDHNYVSDFSPIIDSLGIGDWTHSIVGLELTSLEMGHFNGYPIQVQPGPITHGSFRWFYRPPGELFAQLRGLGTDQQNTIVQVNHPRDSILGYFNGFNLGSYDSTPHQPTSAFSLDQSPQPDGGLSPYAAQNFSYDFDALEVFNGKRDELLFTYRIPQVPLDGADPTIPMCASGQVADCIPAPGEVLQRTEQLLNDGGTSIQPVYPGALDDWYNLLAHGHKVTATGNSDSHNGIAEAGLPRTYLHIGDTADGSMRGLSDQAVVAAIHAGDVVVSNGPFPELTINGVGLGGEVVTPSGDIELKLKVSAAPWIDVQRVFVRRGGPDQQQRPQLLETISVPQTKEVLRLDVTKTYSGVPDGSFVVIEVQGDQSMWPVFTPYEIPSIQISDAVGVIGGAFGFGSKYGRYHPAHVNQVRPFAFTNPIWIDRSKKQPLQRPRNVLPLSSNEPFTPRVIPDIRRIFANFHADPSGE